MGQIDSKPVCLFGLGALLEDCYAQLQRLLGGKPDYLCDNDSEKWGKEFFGVKCISPETLQTLDKSTAIIVTIRNYDSIVEQLKSYGFNHIYTCRFARGYNHVHAFDPVRDALQKEKYTYDDHLKGKWAFITGASRGIGFLIARELAALGVNLIAHGRKREHLAGLENEIEGQGIELIKTSFELSDTARLDELFQAIDDIGKDVDIVYNNAGISRPTLTGEMKIPVENFQDCFHVNALAPVQICYHFLPSMLRRGYGRIVNVSSSIQYRPNEAPYALSKAALDKFVHDMAPSLKETGVAISLLDPGWLKTDMGGDIAPHDPETVLPGALLGAVLDERVNGQWVTARDFVGMDLDGAMTKACSDLK